MVRRLIPSGVPLNIPEEGVAAQLLDFIEDSTKSVSADQWFTLDRIGFETRSATRLST